MNSMAALGVILLRGGSMENRGGEMEAPQGS